jgi:hypothetical protein
MLLLDGFDVPSSQVREKTTVTNGIKGCPIQVINCYMNNNMYMYVCTYDTVWANISRFWNYYQLEIMGYSKTTSSSVGQKMSL